MTHRATPRFSRRSFLRFGALAAAGTLALRLPPAPSGLELPSMRVKSALPLPGYAFLPFPERLLWGDLAHLDAALVPAYVAAQLIQRSLLQPLQGPAGRAHDPEGRYTLPFAYRVAALRYPDARTAPAAARWDDLWAAPGGALWPAFGRVLSGAALLRRGYSPNDSHPGHLAQAADDLSRLGPRIVPDESQRSQNSLALRLVDPRVIGQANALRLPAAATMLIEYDWVISASGPQAAAAPRFIDGLRPAAQTLRADLPVRLIPLMPASAAAQVQHDGIWAGLAG